MVSSLTLCYFPKRPDHSISSVSVSWFSRNFLIQIKEQIFAPLSDCVGPYSTSTLSFKDHSFITWKCWWDLEIRTKLFSKTFTSYGYLTDSDCSVSCSMTRLVWARNSNRLWEVRAGQSPVLLLFHCLGISSVALWLFSFCDLLVKQKN